MSTPTEKKIDVLTRKVDQIYKAITGHELGNEGIVERQKRNREDIRNLQNDMRGLKRLSAETAVLGGLVGVFVKHVIDLISASINNDD